MAGKYKYENGNYYRQSKKGDWFKVYRDPNTEYLTWRLPDGLLIYEKDFKVPVFMKINSPKEGLTFYQVNTGTNGSIGNYPSFEEAVLAYTNALENNNFHESSENILNDVVFDALTGKMVLKGTTTLFKKSPKILKTVAKGVKRLVSRPKTVSKIFGKQAIKTVPVVIGGTVGMYGVDKASEALTDKTWGLNVAEGLTQHYGIEVPTSVGNLTNPGVYYGGWVGNNFSKLGRYTMDNVTPWGYNYKDELPHILKSYILPFYKPAPTYYTYRPKWVKDGEYYDARFENSANWARIPESEVPRKYFTSINKEGLVEPRKFHAELAETPKNPGEEIIAEDISTPGWVGGEHSSFTNLGLYGKNLYYLYEDVLKLNPLWVLADILKSKLGNWKIFDKLGGINLSGLLGYKPFTIRAGYAHPIGKEESIKLVPYKEIEGLN